jgi:hypothetical protein
MEGDLGSYHWCGSDRRYLRSFARGYEDRSYRSGEEALLMSAASEFLQRMIGMRKRITLSRRLIRLANDSELGILCGIVRLTKDILRK